MSAAAVDEPGGTPLNDLAFAAIDGHQRACVFDPPREPLWRVPPGDPGD